MHVRRPSVFVGGELTLDQLDLKYDPHSKVYQAPFQVKATGGVLVVDDFGRQRMPPAELLNRWIVPLEKHFDTLSLHTGTKFPVPFDCLLVFATNLNPRDLVDEAFLRRIQFKVEVRSPDRDAFDEILRMECLDRDIPYDPSAVDLLFHDYYDRLGFRPRGCHPRDLLHQIESVADFRGEAPRLAPELLHRAARSYFLTVEEEYVAGIPSMTTGGDDLVNRPHTPHRPRRIARDRRPHPGPPFGAGAEERTPTQPPAAHGIRVHLPDGLARSRNPLDPTCSVWTTPGSSSKPSGSGSWTSKAAPAVNGEWMSGAMRVSPSWIARASNV